MNRTTYVYPAEVFPTRYRATAHGISAACGKAGAIISALGFNALTDSIGTPAVLYSASYSSHFFLLLSYGANCWLVMSSLSVGVVFMAVCFAGAAFTLLLPETRGLDPDAVLAKEQAEGIAPQ